MIIASPAPARGASDWRGALVVLAAGCALLGSVVTSPARAQFGVEPHPADDRPPLPKFEREPPAVALPPPPATTRQEQLSSGLSVFVHRIELVGNTVFTSAELSAVSSAYEGRELTSEDFRELRLELTRYYVDRGYINSGAIIPDQSVADGVVQIRIFEGRLASVELVGDPRMRRAYLARRLGIGDDAPLNIAGLREDLQILLQSPLVESIASQLAPGETLGEAVLRAQLREPNLVGLGLSIDNDLSPSVGEAQLNLRGSLRNPTGAGDALVAQVGFAEGLNEIFASYGLPLNRHDTSLELSFDRSSSDVVERPFDFLDIESETRTVSVELSHPLFRTAQRQLVASARLDRRESKTSLLGRGTPFAPGVSTNGESDVTVLRLSQDWLSRSQDEVLALRSTFSFGLNALGATVNNDAPDGRFVAWLGQLQWARRVGDDGGEFVFRTDIQFTNDGLLPIEKFAVGGADSVRGYRTNQLVRDRGYAASLEYRHPIFRDEFGRSTLQIAPFVDIGGARNVDAENPGPSTLSSVGIGLRYDPTQYVHAEAYWGKSLRSVRKPEHETLQDHGIHLSLSVDVR